MKAAITLCITLHWINQSVAFFIKGTTGCLEVFARLGEIVIVNEVITCVIGRVYVNHLDCAEIVLAENFEHIKIIALDIEVFGVPKIFGNIEVWTECFVSRLICKT